MSMRTITATLSVSLALGLALALPQPVHAQSDPGTISLDMPAQPLESAVTELARRAGWIIGGNAALLRGKQAPPLRGEYPAETALGMLLEGSGVGYRFTAENTVQLVAQNPDGAAAEFELPAIDVVAGAGGPYLAGLPRSRRLDGPVADIPQGLSVITRAVIDDQDHDSLNEVIINNASVQPGDGFFGRPRVRGFEAAQLNGGVGQPLFNNNSHFNETVSVERVEILKGPASLLYGSLSPGGTINRVLKQPMAEAGFEGSLTGGYGEEDQWLGEASADATGALDGDRTWRGRAIGLIRHSESFRDFVETERYYAEPSVAYVPDDDTSVTLRGFYGYEDGYLDRGLPTMADTGEIAPVDRTANFQEPDDSIVYQNGGLRAGLEQRLGQDLGLNAQLFYERHQEDRVSHDYAGDVAANGDLDRFVLDQYSIRDLYGVQADLNAAFSGGGALHDLRIGVDYRIDDAENRADLAFAPTINIFDPQYDQPNTNPPLDDFRARRVEAYGVYLQERAYLFDGRLVLVAGGRYDEAWLKSEGDGAFAPPDQTLTQSAFSPRAGLVIKPTARWSVYGSYSESFEASDPNAALLNPGEHTDPELSRQWELGSRLELVPGQLMATLAAFRITKENVQTQDPDDPNRNIQVGEQRSEGVELEIAGEVLTGLQLLASATYNETEVTQDNTGLEGNRLPNVPKWAGSLAAQYRFGDGSGLDGWALGTAVYARGERFADIANDTPLDEYLRWDLNAAYGWSIYEVALRIRNVTDEAYISTDTIPGAPRFAEASLTMRY